MRIFIPSKGRAKTISTHKLLNGYDWRVVVHTEEERRQYIGRIPQWRLIVSNTPPGIQHQRNFIKKVLVETGEWYLMMDDNITGFNMIPWFWYKHEYNHFENMNNYRKKIEETTPFKEVYDRLLEDVEKAEKLKTVFVGFSKTLNPYFRCKKYRTVGMVCTKMALVKKDNIRWRKDFKIVDDYPYTAAILYRYGKILLNNYIYPIADHQEEGGIGTNSERELKKMLECKEIVNQYNGLFRLHTRKGQLEGSDIRCRFTSEKQIAEWKEKTDESKIVYTF